MSVNLGSIFWSVQVANAADAAQKASALQEEMGKTTEKAQSANQAVNGASRSMGTYENETDRAAGTTSRFKGVLGLLSTAVFFVGSQMASVLGISASLTGAWGILTTAATTLYGWLLTIGGFLPSLGAIWAGIVSTVQGFVSWLAAGSAGAIAFAGVVGGLLGLLGVFALEWLGVLDAARNFGRFIGNVLPGWARDGLLALIGIFAGGLAVIGAGIAGFVQGYLRGGLSEGIRQAVSNAKRVLAIFSGAFSRILGGVGDTISNWARGVRDWTDKVVDWFRRIPDRIGSLGSRLGTVIKSGFNAALPNEVEFPSITLGEGVPGPDYTIGGTTLSLPSLAGGGIVQEGGLARIHSGEAVVPADVTQQMNLDGGGGGAAGGVNIENISIEIGDQSLDISSLRPSEVTKLAEALAPELGREVENIISP